MIFEEQGIQAVLRGSKCLQISEHEKKLCYFYELQLNEEEATPISHHILLVDVSVSMAHEMLELKNRVRQTLDALKVGGQNYVSIIIYSGHEETSRIVNAVKCDTLSYRMAKVYETVENALYTRSNTVMSEPLEAAVDIVKGLADVCDQHHIVLMTDGCLVPGKWPIKEEVEKCLAVAKYCEQTGIYLNAIGFGQYYDRQFLAQLVEIAQTGIFLHIDAIKDYCKTVIALAQQVNGQKQVDVPIRHHDYFVCDTYTRYGQPTTLKSLPLKESSLVVTFETGGLPVGEVPDELLLRFLYNLGIYHLIYDDLESAEWVLAQTQDLEAYMAVQNCYAFAEKGKAIAMLRTLAYNPDKRFKKGRVPIKMQSPEEEPLCLLEVLDEILKDPESRLLWDYHYKYNHIGIKTKVVDEAYRFIKPEIGYGEVISCDIGVEKLNVNVKVKLEGMVEEKDTGLKVGATSYRDYSLIVNGNRNTTKLWCVLSKPLKAKLRKEKLIQSTTKVGWLSICILNLSNLKTTNKRMYKTLNQKQLAQYLYDVEVLGVQQWALKQLLNKGVANETHETLDPILKRFKINSKGVYTPEHVIKDEALPYEIYPATILVWKVEKFPKKKCQDSILKIYEGMRVEQLQQELMKVQQERRMKLGQIQLVRLSAGLLGKSPFLWEKIEEKDKIQTDKILGINTVIGEKVQVSTKVVDGITIREDRYTVLTRCNV